MPGDGATIEIGVTKAVTAPFKIATFLAISFVVLLVGRLAVDMWVLADNPTQLAQPTDIVERELGRAATAPAFMGSTLDRATRWADFITEWVYRKPGLIKRLDADQSRVGNTERAVLRGVRSMDFAITRAMTGSQVIAIRAAVLASYLPWIGWLYGLAIVDGIVQRSGRKYGGGRESSTLYHRAKYFQVSIATVVTAGVLWWPGDVDFSPIITLATLACALFARLQAEYYKKYV